MDASVFQTQLVKDRTDELTRIHKESLEINEHFKFMSSLLEVQGSKLDRIDMNIANIQDHVSLAKVQLQKVRMGLASLVPSLSHVLAIIH